MSTALPASATSSAAEYSHDSIPATPSPMPTVAEGEYRGPKAWPLPEFKLRDASDAEDPLGNRNGNFAGSEVVDVLSSGEEKQKENYRHYCRVFRR